MVENFVINLDIKSTERAELPNQTIIKGDIRSLFVNLDVPSYGAFFQVLRTYSAGGQVIKQEANRYDSYEGNTSAAAAALKAAMASPTPVVDLAETYAGMFLNLEFPELRIRYFLDPRSATKGEQEAGRCIELATNSMSYKQVIRFKL